VVDGDFDQEVEVVGHQAEGHYAHTAEGFIFAQEGDELLLFEVAEEELAVHDPREAVVISDGICRRSLEAWLAHEPEQAYLTSDLSLS